MMNKNNSPKNANGNEAGEVSRRIFAKTAFGGVGLCYAAAIGYPVYRYLKSPVQKSQAAAAVTEVTLKDGKKLPLASALYFKFGVEPCLLIHSADGKWVALSARCTHLGCTVQYDGAQQRIFCACHGGIYSAETGKNLGGPPPKPLKAFVVKEQPDGSLTVSRV
jgi:cytochrome b6-f complex iron-sulfur subunit